MNTPTFVLIIAVIVSSVAASILSVAVSTWSITNSPRYKLGDQALEMIEECQAALPRNTFCTLYAKEIEE